MSNVNVKSEEDDDVIRKIHFSKGDKHYVASDNGNRKLIFEADKNGKVTNWSTVNDRWIHEAIKYLFEED